MASPSQNGLGLPVYRERSIQLPPDIADLVQRTMEAHPELFGKDETTLRAYFRSERIPISVVTNMLRIQFWREYDRAAGKQMVPGNIWPEVTSHTTWLNTLRNPAQLAWMLTPVMSMVAQWDERIEALMCNLRDVIGAPLVDAQGNVDRQLAKLQFEMLVYFDQRKHGAIIQRVEQNTKSLNVNANMNQNLPADSAKIGDLVDKLSLDEIYARLDEAKKKNAQTPIDVKAE